MFISISYVCVFMTVTLCYKIVFNVSVPVF